MFLDFDPGAADTWSAVNSTRWLNISKHNRITIIVFRTVGVANIALRVRVADAAAGTGNVTTLSAGTTVSATGLLNAAVGTTTINAQVGRIVYEVSADEIAAQSGTAKYLNVDVLAANATDECGVLYILSEPRYPAAANTGQISGNSTDIS
jgi:hypothetical protein